MQSPLEPVLVGLDGGHLTAGQIGTYVLLGLPVGALTGPLGADEGGDGGVAADLVEVAAAGRADAADGDAQLGADVGVGRGRVRGEQGQ